jgi:hypothetical protein
MFSFVLAGVLSLSLPPQCSSDTLPDYEISELKDLFQHTYKPQKYPLFEGHITRMSQGMYRFGSLSMWIDSLSDGMTALLPRGVLYPSLLAPRSADDSLYMANLTELENLSPSPQVRRFSCWIFSKRSTNPSWFAFELTNNKATTHMDMATFIQGARLTFLYRMGMLI